MTRPSRWSGSVWWAVLAVLVAACSSANNSDPKPEEAVSTGKANGGASLSDQITTSVNGSGDNSSTTTATPNTTRSVATTTSTTVREPEIAETCSEEGKRSGVLECRRSTAGLEWMSTEITEFRPDSFGGDDQCRLPDRRQLSVEVGLVIGFPRSLSGVKTPSVGSATLAAVAVDFPDFEGSKSELTRLRESAESFDNWLAFQSNNRLSTSWQIHEEWITMSRPAAEYEVQGFGTGPYQALSTEIVDRVLEVMELRELDELFVYFPDSITDQDQHLDNAFESVLPQIGLPEREIGLFNYSRLRNMKGSGTISKRNGNVLWAIWAHEFLHALGLQLHGPEPTMLIDSASSHSFTLSAWNKWLLGWLDDDQIACLPLDLLPVEIDLVPLEVSPTVDGIRAAIVPLTETSAILIESHRAVGYSANNGYGNGLGIGDPGTYGIIAEYVDSAETAPYDPFTNDDSAGTRFLYSADLLAGTRENYGTVAFAEWKHQPLVYLGETVDADSLTVEFTASSGVDTIRIARSP